MFNVARRRTLVATGSFVAIALGLTAWGIVGSGVGATSGGPSLEAVSSSALAQEGIQLQPPTSTAAVTQAAAENAAVAALPGSTVRQSVLAEFTDSNHVPVISALAWAVSLSPPTGFDGPSVGPAGGGPGTAAGYVVVFINAQTGTMLEGIAGS